MDLDLNIEKDSLLECREKLLDLQNRLVEVFKSPESIKSLDRLNSAAAPFLKSINSDQFTKESNPFSEIYNHNSLKVSSSFNTYYLRPGRDKISSYHVNVGLEPSTTLLSFNLASQGYNNNLSSEFYKTPEITKNSLETAAYYIEKNYQIDSDKALDKLANNIENLCHLPQKELQSIVSDIIENAHEDLIDTAARLGFTMKGTDEDIELIDNLCRQRYSNDDFKAIMSEKARELSWMGSLNGFSYDRNLVKNIDDDLKAAIKVVDRLNLKLYDFAIIDNKFYGIAKPTKDPVDSYCLIDCTKAKTFKEPDLARTITEIKINPDTFGYRTDITLEDVKEVFQKKLKEQNPSPTLEDSSSKALVAAQLLLDQQYYTLHDIVIINDHFYPVCSKYDTDLNRVDDRYIVDPDLLSHLPVQNFKDSLIRVS